MTAKKYIEEKINKKLSEITDEKMIDKKINLMEQLKFYIIEVYEASILVEDEGRLNYSADDNIKRMVSRLNSYNNNELLELRLYLLSMISIDIASYAIGLAQTDLAVHSDMGYLVDLSYDINLHDESNTEERRNKMYTIIDKFTLEGKSICIDRGYKNPTISNQDKYTNIPELGNKKCISTMVRVVGKNLLDEVINKLEDNGFKIIRTSFTSFDYNKR